MKAVIQVEEKVSYSSEITVDLPADMSSQQFDSILDSVERSCRRDSARDVAYELSKYGIKIQKVVSGFPDSPDDSELEIFDLSILED